MVELTAEQYREFDELGACCIRQLFCDWIRPLKWGIKRNIEAPGPHASMSRGEDQQGLFFDDYHNWNRIPEFRQFVYHSPASELAGRSMRSAMSRILSEHVIVKDAGTSAATPWHHDMPYLNVLGEQLTNIWVALDPAEQGIAPEFIVGSHQWGRLFQLRRFEDGAGYEGTSDLEELPDLSDEKLYPRVGWDVEPGDALLFHTKTLHGTSARRTTGNRWGFSTLWMGDDIRFAGHAGRLPFPWNDLPRGAEIPEAACPVVWRSVSAVSH